MNQELPEVPPILGPRQTWSFLPCGSISWEGMDWSSLGQRTLGTSFTPQTSRIWNHLCITEALVTVILQELIGLGMWKQEKTVSTT